MGFWDTLKAWLGREAADLAVAKRETEERLDAELSAREARLHETPDQAMERLQREMAANDDALGDIRDRIAGQGAQAEARRAEDAASPPGGDDASA